MSHTLREFIKAAPLIAGFLQTDTWRRIRHRQVLRSTERDGSKTFTRFIRLPTQFEALAGPVIDFIGPIDRPMKIAVLACSNGAEAYSAASVLRTSHPQLEFEIIASDINPQMVEKAKTARYTRDEVYDNKIMREEFVTATFERDGDAFIVKPEIARKVTFCHLDAADPDMSAAIGTVDIVFAQNFLFNLPRDLAAGIFKNILTLLNSRAALFIEGMDYDQRAALTRRARLRPLDYKIEQIHNDALSERAVGWPFGYWGLEPFSRYFIGWRRRYATIYLKQES